MPEAQMEWKLYTYLLYRQNQIRFHFIVYVLIVSESSQNARNNKRSMMKTNTYSTT